MTDQPPIPRRRWRPTLAPLLALVVGLAVGGLGGWALHTDRTHAQCVEALDHADVMFRASSQAVTALGAIYANGGQVDPAEAGQLSAANEVVQAEVPKYGAATGACRGQK